MNELSPQSSVRADTAIRDAANDALSRKAPVDDKKAAVDEPTGGKQLPQPAAKESTNAVQEHVAKAVSQLNDYVQSLQRDLKFTLDPELGRPVVSVVDSNTQQVIRQIPNDVAIRLARNLKDVEGSVADPNGATGYNAGSNQSLGLINTKI